MKVPISRNNRIDGMKFVLIFLVILGHLSYYDFSLGVNRLIDAFHMPMFVMISGYFTHKQPSDRFWHSSLKLLALYLIFQTGHLFFNSLVYGSHFSINGYLKPALAMWYLLCLFYWRCAYRLFQPMGIKPLFALIASIILSIIAGFIPLGNDDLAFQRTFSFLPFFIFGLILKDKGLTKKLTHLNVPFMVMLLLMSLVCARLLPNFMPSSPYEVWNDMILRLVQTIIAFIICIGIIRFLPRKMPDLFCSLGQWTLYYYLYHTFMTKALSYVLDKYQLDLNVFQALCCMLVIVITITAMHRVKMFRLLLLEK